MTQKIIALIANEEFTITNFRKELILSLASKGHKIYVLSNKSKTLKAQPILNSNIKFISLNISRKGLNPIKDLYLIFKLYNILSRIKPDYVFNYTIKPVIYGGIAAKLAKVKSISSFITGLGFIYTHNNIKATILKTISNILYKVSLKFSTHVFFQNPDDLNLFLNYNLVSREKAHIINGSGVDLEKFKPTNIQKIPNSFVFVGRLLKDKGIGELIEAAKTIKSKYIDCSFWICGSLDDHPTSLSEQELKKLIEEKVINYIPHSPDIPNFLSNKEVFILPSYREGTPRSVLEAMAMGMPIITTNAPGCKETTTHRVNGVLVEPKSSTELTNAIEIFIKNPEHIIEMGKKSLEIARNKYDVNLVNANILKTVGII